MEGHINIVRLLVERGSPIDSRNKKGETHLSSHYTLVRSRLRHIWFTVASLLEGAIHKESVFFPRLVASYNMRRCDRNEAERFQ